MTDRGFNVKRTPQKAFSELDLRVLTIEDHVRAHWPFGEGDKPSFMEHFPLLVRPLILDTFKAIVLEASPTADEHRATDVVTMPPGVTMSKIKEKLLERLPWIKIKYPNGPSETTLRHLMSSPHKGRVSAKSYSGEVPAKLAFGQNNKRSDSSFVRPCVDSLLFTDSIVVPCL